MKSSIENIYKLKVNQIIDYIKFNLHQPLQIKLYSRYSKCVSTAIALYDELCSE